MERYKKHSARIAPAPPPLPTDIQQAIDAVMRGNTPLVLFTTLARDRRLFFKFFSSGLLDRGHLTIRQRVHVEASQDIPWQTDSAVSTTPDEVMDSAQSRFGPAAPLIHVNRLLDGGKGFAVLARPQPRRHDGRHMTGPMIPTQHIGKVWGEWVERGEPMSFALVQGPAPASGPAPTGDRKVAELDN
jgi:hypothetical protein